MKNMYMMFSCILLMFIMAGCSDPKPSSQANGKVIVFAGIPPISNIAQIIGGEYISVNTLLPAGQSPHSFTPRPGLVKKLGQAKLYISVNMPFEQNIILPLLKRRDISVCAADKGINKICISESHHTHDHTSEAKHDEHSNHDDPAEHIHAIKAEAKDNEDHAKKLAHPDPHIWLSTANDIIIAGNITDSLCEIDPAHAAVYRQNLASFTKKVTQVKVELERLLAPFKGRTLYVYHPAFGYFAAEFGMKQQAVEHEGKQPTPKEIATLIKNAKHDGVKFIFVQPRFSERSAEIIATQVGAQVIRLNPLSGDLLGNYVKIAESIKLAMSKTGKE
jgi:zinc transport system substrate-binding protein